MNMSTFTWMFSMSSELSHRMDDSLTLLISASWKYLGSVTGVSILILSLQRNDEGTCSWVKEEGHPPPSYQNLSPYLDDIINSKLLQPPIMKLHFWWFKNFNIKSLYYSLELSPQLAMSSFQMTMKLFGRVSKEKNLKLWNCLPMMHANVGPT